METNLCLQTRHLPAMCHQKKLVVHSSVRLPAVQAKVGPPPGAARVAVVGAGVVLTCALGTMYWKRYEERKLEELRARAQLMPCSSSTRYVGRDADINKTLSELVSTMNLPARLSEICIGKSGPRPLGSSLSGFIDQCLTEKEKVQVRKSLTSVLERKFPETIEVEDDYNLGLFLTLVMINEKEYATAKDFGKKLDALKEPEHDFRPDLLLATIHLMAAKEKVLKLGAEPEVKNKLDQVVEAWGKILELFPTGPPI